MTRSALEESIEAVVRISGDPTPQVYARLFSEAPETEAAFMLDATGAVRAQMIIHALDCLLDIVGPRRFGAQFIQAEVMSHENLGVSPAVFSTFYPIVRDTFREIAGTHWTPEMDRAWDAALNEVEQVLGRPVTL